MRRQKPPSQRRGRPDEREWVGWLCAVSASMAIKQGCSVDEARASVLGEVRAAFGELVMDEHSWLHTFRGSSTPEVVLSVPAMLQRTMEVYGRNRRDPYTEELYTSIARQVLDAQFPGSEG